LYICIRYPEERSKAVKGVLALKGHIRINRRFDNVLTHIDDVVGNWGNSAIPGRLKRVGVWCLRDEQSMKVDDAQPQLLDCRIDR
jgi:uncharacterized protein YutD